MAKLDFTGDGNQDNPIIRLAGKSLTLELPWMEHKITGLVWQEIANPEILWPQKM